MPDPLDRRQLPPESTYRRRRLAGLSIVLGLLVALINATQWVQHARLRERIDAELGDRLLSVAATTALVIDGEMLRRWEDWGVDLDERDRLQDDLARVIASGSVSNVYLLDPDGLSILDLSGLVERGEFNPIVALDRAAFLLAASGIPEASALRNLDGGYLKAGYVPIESDEGDVVAVLAVEGASGPFAVLGDLRKTLVAVAVGSGLGIVVLGLILVRISDSLARAEAELLRAETLTTMGRMAAGIAHEIRNPLGIIRASAERLRRATRGESSQVDLADSIVEEVDRLNGIVTGYLNFATGRAGGMEPVDLVTLVRRTLKLAASELEGVAVSTEIELPAARVMGDGARLRQVLLNLILNARQAMPDGGALRVQLDADRNGSPRRYRLRLADTGVGIARAKLSEVWKPFFTSKPEGSGLGLAVVRRIVDEHHGEIGIVSREGVGTTVTVELPALEEDREGPGA